MIPRTNTLRGFGAPDQNSLLIKISVTVQIERIEVDEAIDDREVSNIVRHLFRFGVPATSLDHYNHVYTLPTYSTCAHICQEVHGRHRPGQAFWSYASLTCIYTVY